MGRARKGDRVSDRNYFDASRNRWRYRIIGAEGGFTYSESFSSEAASERERLKARDALDETAGRTIEEVVDEYDRLHLRIDQKNKDRTRETTLYRINIMLQNQAMPMSSLVPGSGQAFYDRLVYARICTETVEGQECGAEYQADKTARCPKGHEGKGRERYSAASHRNALNQARTFVRWCIEKKYLKVNIFDGVKGKGKKKKGKPQPTFDEVKQWYWYTYPRACRVGHEGDAAALLTYVFGMRTIEVVTRTVRDVDLGGDILHDKGKTEAGNRAFEVPAEIKPILLRLCKDKTPGQYLFGDGTAPRNRNWVTKHVKLNWRRLGIREYSAQSMRGLHSTTAYDAGATAAMIVRQMGHTTFEVTKGHYLAPGTVERSNTRRLMSIVRDAPDEGEGRRGPQRAPEPMSPSSDEKIK
jgi:integrase